jgi:hypothetical protein
MIDLYKDAHERTEPDCMNYLLKKGFFVNHLGEKRNAPNYGYYKNYQYELPDLEVKKNHSSYVEVKAYDEALHPDYYSKHGLNFPEWRDLINNLTGQSRFKYGQLHNFTQGIDVPQFLRFAYFQFMRNQTPVLFAFQDHTLKTGIWYGAWLHEFINNKLGYKGFKPRNGQKIEQYYLPLSEMKPIEEKLNEREKNLYNFLNYCDRKKLSEFNINLKEFFEVKNI